MVKLKRIEGPEFDGVDFGAPASHRSCYRLYRVGHPVDEKLPRAGGAGLEWIDANGIAHECSIAFRWGWTAVEAVAMMDFAPRMEAAGRAPGRFPEPGGEVFLARAIGEELGALMAVCDSLMESSIEPVDGRQTHAALWLAATPEWRRSLWHMVAPMGHVITIDQRVAVSAAPEEQEFNWMLKALRGHDSEGMPLVARKVQTVAGVRSQTAHEIRRGHEQRARREKQMKARAERMERAA